MNRGAFYGVIASLLWFRLHFPIWLILLILLALYAIMGGYSYLSVVARTIKRDITWVLFCDCDELFLSNTKMLWFYPFLSVCCSGLTRYLQVLLRVRSFQRKNWTVPTVFETYVKAHPNKVAFVFEGREWTFKEVRTNSCFTNTWLISFSVAR